MSVPRSITVGDSTFAIVNEVDNGNTVIVDAVAPNQMLLSVSVLKSRCTDVALGAILMAAWGQSLSTRRAPL